MQPQGLQDLQHLPVRDTPLAALQIEAQGYREWLRDQRKEYIHRVVLLLDVLAR